VMSQKGMDSLLTSKFKLGGDASVALGPVGAERSRISPPISFRFPGRRDSTQG